MILIGDIVLLLLKEGLKSAKNIQEILKYVASFNVISKQHNTQANSLAGKQIIKETLINCNIQAVDLDTYVVACFQNKNRFIFNVLLSLPNADLGLLVSKKDKSFFRPS
ncbi:MAG: hypothetical protein H0T84_14500, partial [Tatlockia sp.]|nr:hypothetical protein [Tatlockia sp.]